MHHTRVNADDLLARMKQGERFVLLDALHPDVWVIDDGHAERLPDEHAHKVGDFLHGRTIVVYGDSEAAGLYANTLLQQGYFPVQVLLGGARSFDALGIERGAEIEDYVYPTHF